MKILSSVSIPEPKDSLMSIVAAADYRIEAKGIGLIATDILEYDEVITTKKSKGKQITVDIRSLILDVRKVDAIKKIRSSSVDYRELNKYLKKKKRFYPIALLPAIFITSVCITYIMYDKIGFNLDLAYAKIVSVIFALIFTALFFFLTKKSSKI